MLTTPFNTNTSPLLNSNAATQHPHRRHHCLLRPAHRFASLIDNSKTVDHLLQIHAALLRHGLHNHPVLNFKLQRSYSSLHRLDHSTTLFASTRSPNVFLWTSIIHAHAVRGLHNHTLQLFVKMLTHGVHPNAFTFSSVLRSCPLKPGKCIHSQAIKCGFDLDAYVRTALVDVYAKGGDLDCARQLFDTMLQRNLVSSTAMVAGYVKHGDVDEARALFDEMQERDVACWSVMIDGYTQQGKPNEALLLFRQMLEDGVKPSEVTILYALSACGQLGALESGKWIHSYIENNGFQGNIQVRTAVIDMYNKSGSLEDARANFDKIAEKDVVAWNSMIFAYAMHGLSEGALALFNQMRRVGSHPNDVTFIGMLRACGVTGLVNEGWRIFNSMKDDYGLEPGIEHYGCMVNLLGRAGRLIEAYELVKGMKIDPDPVLWATLLWACKLHGNIALGEAIAEILVSEHIEDSGIFALLSNTYSSAGNWDGVAMMSKLIKDSGLKKEPGRSVVEVNNEVHEFVAGDWRHPKCREIYMKLDEINGWLRAHGHCPQTQSAAHDVEETEDPRPMEYHSEKVAIAFGLISTAPETTIKIVANLRMCSDCHAVTKLISKITRRTILVRDRCRFHHFASGMCSCGDYW